MRDADDRPAASGELQDTETELVRLRTENTRRQGGKGNGITSGILRRRQPISPGICRVREVSHSGYYRWITSAQARAAAEDALVEEIRAVHAGHRGNYGALRVHAELRGVGHTINRNGSPG
ncbi:IS3 family transposase [Streptomyces sp. NPDC048270]|uniref:IS3 family transposase n=1 Tax=Streptomyces sp. NPDC048270 TaxID=3154615 RepID=UPI003409597E